MNSIEALRAAILEAGGQNALARTLGVKQSTVWHWLKKSRRGVPAEYAQAVEHAAKGKITKEQLRPDIWLNADTDDASPAKSSRRPVEQPSSAHSDQLPG